MCAYTTQITSGTKVSALRLVMPDHLARVSPFLPAAFLRVVREDEIDLCRNQEECTIEHTPEHSDSIDADDVHGYTKFIILDGGTKGRDSLMAVGRDKGRTKSRVAAISGRHPNGDRISNIFHCYYNLPPLQWKDLNVWLASQTMADLRNHLLTSGLDKWED